MFMYKQHTSCIFKIYPPRCCVKRTTDKISLYYNPTAISPKALSRDLAAVATVTDKQWC